MTAIAVIDVETTGKDRSRDQIIELVIQLGIDAGSEVRGWRIKPTVEIHPEAQSVHGITAEALDACPSFGDVAQQVVAYLNDAEVIVGYNVAFDLDMLQAELQRAGLPPLELSNKKVVDVLRLWQHVEPRTLVAAVAKFCGEQHDGAHQAAADVAATGRVLSSMLTTFGLADKPWGELAAMADPFPGRENWVGPSHHIKWDDQGNARFAFGKNTGVIVAYCDPGFLRWVVGKDFPAHVQEICVSALKMSAPEFLSWLRGRFPRVERIAA